MNFEDVVIVKYGEIALRGKNRSIYENMLIKSIKKNLDGIGDFYIRKEQGRFVVESKDAFDDAAVISRASCVFGVVAAATAKRLKEQDMGTLKAAARLCVERQYKPGVTFRVATRRANKTYPLTSDKISAEIGEYLLEQFPDMKVDLKSAELVVKIELRNDAYVYSDEVRGPGGLPPGSAGKGVLLLSGGIDSPVAGYLAAKRGIGLMAVYFHAPPYTSERAREKVLDLARQLALSVGQIEVMVVNVTPVQIRLAEAAPPEKMTIMLKRAMLKMAEMAARKTGALALITGDSVGQVASQTLHSLNATSSAASCPIIRPLSCFDKYEIVNIAKKIGTYDISIRPYEDCCTVFLPKNPETKPKESIIASIESNITGLTELMEEAVATAEKYEM